MKVKCLTINNKYTQFENDFQRRCNHIDYDFLEIDKIYTVYGMIVDQGQTCYYICDQANRNFPISRPFNLFEVVNRDISRYWVFSFMEGNRTYPCWMFPEWFDNDYFQDMLTDGEKDEVSIFLRYKQLMDLEYPDTTIKVMAEVIDEKWLYCPLCRDAWESTSNDGMVICPNCHNVMHNPSYKSFLKLN